MNETTTPVGADEDVGGAKVAVDDPRAVDRPEPGRDGPADLQRERGGKRPAVVHERPEVGPLDPLRHQRVVRRAKDADDVRVVHSARQPHLPREPLAAPGVGARPEGFEEHDLARLLVQRLVDDGNGPARDFGERANSERGGDGDDGRGGQGRP